jgi:hypothetical protein
MRVPLSWLREYVDVAAGTTPEDVLASLVSVGVGRGAGVATGSSETSAGRS